MSDQHRIAWHEAGHAVADHFQGLGVASVRVWEGGGDCLALAGIGYDTAYKQMVSAVAGAEAERLAGWPDPRESRADRAYLLVAKAAADLPDRDELAARLDAALLLAANWRRVRRGGGGGAGRGGAAGGGGAAAAGRAGRRRRGPALPPPGVKTLYLTPPRPRARRRPGQAGKNSPPDSPAPAGAALGTLPLGQAGGRGGEQGQREQ